MNAFPQPASLSSILTAAIPVGSTSLFTANVTPSTAKMFTTASVNMWMRAVHSFLISASLTDVSPIWASVTGYYSSHYAVRGIAHLLGFFQLFKARRVVRLQWQGGRYVCSFTPKKTQDREHKLYWQVVKTDKHFASDPFFCSYNPGIDDSDVRHRDWANYADHLPQLPVFRPLNAEALKNRIDRISEIEFASPPIPRLTRYPDIASVQTIAYHRLVRFRELVDTVLGNGNRFWSVHRDPTWAREFMDFQLIDTTPFRSQFILP